MPSEHYHSASEMIRNLSQITCTHEVLHIEGKLRVVKFERSCQGYQIWLINEKGFLWEPCDDIDAALEYLVSEEGQEYNLS